MTTKAWFKQVYDWELNESLFDNTTVGQLIYDHKDCVMIDPTTSVEKALEIMVMRGFSSLPVRDKDHQFIGLLSMADIVAHMSGYVVSATTTTSTIAPPLAAVRTSGGSDDDAEQQHLRHFEGDKDALNFPCQQLLGLTWESKHVISFDSAERLTVVLAKLSSTGAHRALVHGKGWWQVISQWDIAVWLARHCTELDDPNLASLKHEWLGSITNATLDELNMIESKHVVSIPHSMTAMAGFRQLARYGVSAMPIIAENGTLCGTLSNNDLRGMDHTKLKALSLPVMEFLRVANLLQFTQVVANGRMKFGDIMLRIRSRDVHRVWIISGDNKPIGVLSLTDIIHKISSWLILPPPQLASPAVPAPATAAATYQPSTEKLGSSKDETAVTGCSYGNQSCNCGSSCSCQKGSGACSHEYMKGLPQPSSALTEKMKQQAQQQQLSALKL